MDIKRQERAPIYEALEEFKKKRVVPFDVPGHKRGRGNPELVHLLGEKCVGLDVNSMKPLDNLCHPVSVIREAEELAADAFGAANAFLMVGGTTSAVQAMILSTCKAGDKIILPRNVHKSALNALVLCGAIPVYVNPQTNAKLGISLGMEIDQVARAIEENPDAKAVLVNNPDSTILLPRFSCHTLRHTFTTRMCEAGVNVKVIQDALGHSDISTTLNIYADVTKELRKSEFENLDRQFAQWKVPEE